MRQNHEIFTSILTLSKLQTSKTKNILKMLQKHTQKEEKKIKNE